MNQEHEDEHLRIMDLDGDEEYRALLRHLQRHHQTDVDGGAISFLHSIHDELHLPGRDEVTERCPVCHEEVAPGINCGHTTG